MRSGRLDKRVTIQQLVTGSPTQNAGGEQEDVWTTVHTVWASVRPLRGRELFAAQQINSEISSTVQIRYRAGITSKMRLSYDGRLFDILAVVNPDERNEQLVLSVREGINDG